MRNFLAGVIINMVTSSDQSGQPEPIDSRRLFLGIGWTLLIFVLCLFLPAGTWTWTRGWLFILVMVVASILTTIYLRGVNPEVTAARINRHKDKTLGSDLAGDLPADRDGEPMGTPWDGSIPSRDRPASSARSS
jgi:hypothetical protein